MNRRSHQLLAKLGVIRLKDVMKEGRFATDQELTNRYGTKNPDPELWGIFASIPEALQRIDEFDGGLTRAWEKLEIGGVKMKSVKSKHLQRRLKELHPGFPKSVIEWQRQGIVVRWRRFWRVAVPGAWSQTGFLLRHRALMTGERAERMGWKAFDSRCKECEVLETVEHLFWECPRAECIRDHWPTFEKFINEDTTKQRMLAHVVWAGRCEERIQDIPWSRERTRNRIEKEEEWFAKFEKSP